MWSDNPDWEYNARERAEKAAIGIRLETLGTNLELAGALAAYGRSSYAKGFTDCELLKAFCEDYVPEPYFPIADNRPTADRLKWPRLDDEYCKHMLGAEGSCARCEGT